MVAADRTSTHDAGGAGRARPASPWLAAIFLFILILSYPVVGTFSDASSMLSSQDPTHPVANAGADINVVVGVPARLNGTLSTDDVGIVNYTWTFDDGGVKTLYGPFANYTFWTVGVRQVTLNVTDADNNSDTDVVAVNVLADVSPPRPVSGRNKTVYVDTLVKLNGSGTRDNGVVVNYTWNFTYDGQEVVLYGIAADYWFNKTGRYVIQLTVRDGGNLTAAHNFTLTVKKVPTWLDKHWLGLSFWSAIVLIVAVWVQKKYKRDGTLYSAADKDRLRLAAIKSKELWKLFIATWMGRWGVAIILWFLLMVVVAETVLPYNPNMGSPDILEDPSPEHWLGTDQSGRDVFTRTFHGTKASLIVGFVAMAISMGLGTFVGLVSGYWGGWRDEVIMRANDVFLSIPWLVLMIVIAAIWGRQDLSAVIIVIGITGWSTTARIVRAQVLTLKTRQFVERAKAIGSSDWHIMSKHIFPNTVPLVFANAILTIAIAILSESTLSFIGLGPQDVETWGRILDEAYDQGAALAGPYTYIIVPGLCIVFVVLGFTFIGYAMDEVLNPRLRER